MKELQAKYRNDPQMQQQKLTQLYQDNDVNPLAGCLPALVQIPIFISLYRALTNLANEVRVCVGVGVGARHAVAHFGIPLSAAQATPPSSGLFPC
jgi:YidC/Oxa1 family membrane protein insertase